MNDTSFPKDLPRRKRAVAMAKNRGIVAEEWLKTHSLNHHTFNEFYKLMKQTDKEFLLNKSQI
jgi:hypothetical protein